MFYQSSHLFKYKFYYILLETESIQSSKSHLPIRRSSLLTILHDWRLLWSPIVGFFMYTTCTLRLPCFFFLTLIRKGCVCIITTQEIRGLWCYHYKLIILVKDPSLMMGFKPGTFRVLSGHINLSAINSRPVSFKKFNFNVTILSFYTKKVGNIFYRKQILGMPNSNWCVSHII